MNTVKNVDGFAYGREVPAGSKSNQVGVSVEYSQTLRFIVSSYKERENWIQALENAFIVSTETPFDSEAVSKTNEKTGAVFDTTSMLFAELMWLDPQARKGTVPWAKRIVSLDDEGFVHIYSEDMQSFTKPPVETMNLSTAISVRLCDVETGRSIWHNFPSSPESHVFQINTTKRVVFFKANSAYEAVNWVLEVRKVIMTNRLLPSSELVMSEAIESPIIKVQPTNYENSAAMSVSNLFPLANIFLCVIDGAFYYFSNNLSCVPLNVISSSQFEDVGSGGEQGTFFFDVFFRLFSLRHYVSSAEERDRWVSELGNVRAESYDLLGKLGIEKDKTLNEEVAKAKGNVFSEKENMINYLDDKKLDKGEQTCMIGIFGKIKIAVSFLEASYTSLKSDASFVLDCGMFAYMYVTVQEQSSTIGMGLNLPECVERGQWESPLG